MYYTLNERVHKNLKSSAIEGAGMPKQIENVKRRALEAAKRELLQSDYSGFTIRSVAKKCGIAVGTIYNYFPSKDLLAASVMLEDWNGALLAMRQGSSQSDTITDGLNHIYKEIEHFSSVYKGVWSQYSLTSQFASDYSERHGLLINQLSEIIHDLLVRFHAQEDTFLENFVAENLLLAAVNQNNFKSLANLLDRMFVNKGKEEKT